VSLNIWPLFDKRQTTGEARVDARLHDEASPHSRELQRVTPNIWMAEDCSSLILEALKRELINVTLSEEEKPDAYYDDSANSYQYIIFVLVVYAVSFLAIMVKYFRHSGEGNKEENLYEEFVKRERFMVRRKHFVGEMKSFFSDEKVKLKIRRPSIHPPCKECRKKERSNESQTFNNGFFARSVSDCLPLTGAFRATSTANLAADNIVSLFRSANFI